MQTLAAIFSAWSWNAAGLVCCGALLALYAAFTGFRRTRGLAWFLASVIILAMVVCSPLDLLARQYLLTAEAIEQVLIGLVVTFMLVLGTPEKAVRRLRVPYYIAWCIGMLAVSIWYLPSLLNASLDSVAVRCLEYVTLILGGVAFWLPLHSPRQEQRIPMVPQSLFYLAAATVWCSLAGLFLAFSHLSTSLHYTHSSDTLGIADSLVNDWRFSRETDQETAGLLFWIISATVLLTEVMFTYYRWYNSPEVQDESRSGTPGDALPSR